MKKHPLLAAGAAAGTAVLGAAYAVYRVAFYQKPTTKVPSPADMPTRECYSKAMGPDADALARDMFKAVHITAQDGTPLAARYYHHADGAPLAIIFHGYRGYAERDGLGGYTLCTALGYNVLLPDQRAHGYSGGHTITMGREGALRRPRLDGLGAEPLRPRGADVFDGRLDGRSHRAAGRRAESAGQRLRHRSRLRLHQPARDHPQMPAGVPTRLPSRPHLRHRAAGGHPVRPF